MEEQERCEILLEHIAKDVRTVAEGHISLNQKIDRNHEEARQMNRNTNNKLDIIAQTLSRKTDTNREKIEQVDQKVEINRVKIEEVDNKLNTNLEDHEDRIKVLEIIN